MAECARRKEEKLKMEKSRTWVVKKYQLRSSQQQRGGKSASASVDSPTFDCGGYEIFFRLELGCNVYYLSLVAKAWKGELRPFDMTFYLEGRNGPRHFGRRTVRNLPTSLLKFPDHEEWGRESRYEDDLKFVFLFHGDTNPRSQDRAGENEDLEWLSRDYYRLWKESSTHDMQLNPVDNGPVNLHSIFLKARSEAYDSLQKMDMLPQIAFQTAEELASYIYSGKLSDLTADSARSLYLAANDYGVSSLKKRLSGILGSSITKENALETLQLADTNKDSHLKEDAIVFILRSGLLREREKWMDFTEKNGELAYEVWTFKERQENPL